MIIFWVDRFKSIYLFIIIEFKIIKVKIKEITENLRENYLKFNKLLD